MSTVVTILDYVARGIGWPVLLLVVLAALLALIAAAGTFIVAGYNGFVPTLQAARALWL